MVAELDVENRLINEFQMRVVGLKR